MDAHTILRQKTDLLCNGLYLDEKLIDLYKKHGINIDFGRKGGAGPSGGRYFYLKGTKSLINIALWNDPKKTRLVLKEYEDGFFKVYDAREKGHFGKLKLIQPPKFYDQKTSDGTEMKKVALVHGQDCLASTIYQKCVYWGCGEQCRFCGIEYTLESGNTILEKSPQQMSEVVNAAIEEGRCSHMTLTSGTTGEKGRGAKRYIEMCEYLKESHPNIPLHVQIEALEDLSYIKRLNNAGADTIGIHIEVLNSVLRSTITPAKSKIPYELFKKNWEYAVDVFGKNQVDTFLLTGFGESRYDFIEEVEEVIQLGVIPYVTPVRDVPSPEKRTPMPKMNQNALLEVYTNVARMMKKNGLNPHKNKAGCVRCGGCSAIKEAYNAI